MQGHKNENKASYESIYYTVYFDSRVQDYYSNMVIERIKFRDVVADLSLRVCVR